MSDMDETFPDFSSEDEMRDWFDSADLSTYKLDEALGIVASAHIELAVGDEPASTGTTTRGAIGTLREPVKLLTA